MPSGHVEADRTAGSLTVRIEIIFDVVFIVVIVVLRLPINACGQIVGRLGGDVERLDAVVLRFGQRAVRRRSPGISFNESALPVERARMPVSVTAPRMDVNAFSTVIRLDSRLMRGTAMVATSPTTTSSTMSSIIVNPCRFIFTLVNKATIQKLVKTFRLCRRRGRRRYYENLTAPRPSRRGLC